MIRDIGIPGISSKNLLEAMFTMSFGRANIGVCNSLENCSPSDRIGSSNLPPSALFRKESNMIQGITREQAKHIVGPGWSGILDHLYDKLPKKLYVMQVKEKYGSLRFYIGSGSNRTFALIDKAEKESEITCEVCGKEGKIFSIRGWYMCRCPECRKEEEIKSATVGQAVEK